MAIVKKYKNGFVVIDEFTGQPVTQRLFKKRSAANQYASDVRSTGYFT